MTSVAAHPHDLEPARLEAGQYATRRRSRIDVAVIASLLVCLLYIVPANQIIPQLTIAGRPALLLAMVLFAWWVLARLSPALVMAGPQPLRWVALVYLVTLLLSYLAGLLRGLPTLESNRQNFTVLVTLEFLGVLLMAADGIRNWSRLLLVLRVLVWSAGFMAVVGLIQSVFEFNVAEYLTLPGLQSNAELIGFEVRGIGSFRIAGTATHYIEFSTVLAMAAPFALHFARYGASRNSRLGYSLLTILIVGVIPMAISRTGVVAIGAAGAVMFVLVWDWRTRYNMALLGLVMVVGLMAVRPGLVGTLRSLFLAGEADPSILGRTVDYEFVARWFEQRPWLGRGPGTLIPDLYIILDNQWLMTLVTGGVVGVAALAGLHLTCITLAAMALRRSTRAADRDICAALIATQVIAVLVAATFDSLSFTTFTFTLALLSGLSGAVWRFSHPSRQVRTSTPAFSDRQPTTGPKQ